MMSAWTRIAAGVAVCSVAASVPASAQETRTFAHIAAALRDGSRVRLVIDGATIDGQVTHAEADRFVISRGPGNETFDVPLARLERLTYDDGVANGALIGAAIGAAPGIWGGIMARMLCENEAGSCDSAPFVIGGLTAAIGLGVGVTIDEAIRTTVRFARPRASASVSVAPDPRRPSATLSIRF